MTGLYRKLSPFWQKKQRAHLTTHDITLFLRQFATLMQAGIPLIQCFNVLGFNLLDRSKASLYSLIQHIKTQLYAGKTLHTALQPYPQYFNAFVCKMIQLGERTGTLENALLIVAQYCEKKAALKKQIQRALFYPCLLIVSACCITGSLFLFIIPHFATLFADTHTPLPMLTLLLLHIATFVKIACLPCLFLVGVLISIALFRARKRQESLRAYLKRISTQNSGIQHVTFRLPIIKNFWRNMIMIQFARNLSLSLRSGIVITEALTLTTSTDYPATARHAIAQLRLKLNSGLSLHKSMLTIPFFPDFLVQMTKIGEETGTLEALLEKTADFFETELEQHLSQLCTLLEPLIMLIVGALIGGLVIGMYLPIFKLGSAL